MNEAYKRYDIVLGAVLIVLATLPAFLIIALPLYSTH